MVLPLLYPLPSLCPFVCRCRNSSSLHLQSEEGFPCGGEERASSPRPPRTLSHIRRARSGTAPRTVLGVRTREAECELTWTELCVLEGTHSHTHECAGVSCQRVYKAPVDEPLSWGAGSSAVETRGNLFPLLILELWLEVAAASSPGCGGSLLGPAWKLTSEGNRTAQSRCPVPLEPV